MLRNDEISFLINVKNSSIISNIYQTNDDTEKLKSDPLFVPSSNLNATIFPALKHETRIPTKKCIHHRTSTQCVHHPIVRFLSFFLPIPRSEFHRAQLLYQSLKIAGQNCARARSYTNIYIS